MYTQLEIDALIVCEKAIVDPPKKSSKLEGGDFRNNMKLSGPSDVTGEFVVFMRQCEDFQENFSIGLRYLPKDGRPEIGLLRCNGQHGVFNASVYKDSEHSHWGYHIHKGSEHSLKLGFAADKFAEHTKEYASYEEAIAYFVVAINIRKSDIDRHFEVRSQKGLF